MYMKEVRYRKGGREISICTNDATVTVRLVLEGGITGQLVIPIELAPLIGHTIVLVSGRDILNIEGE